MSSHGDVSMTDAMQSDDNWSDDDAASDWSDDGGYQVSSEVELPRCFDRSKIHTLQHEMIQRVSSALDVTPAAACTMLRCCKWSEHRTIESYQSDSSGFVNQCGVAHSLHLDLSDVETTGEFDCPICFDTVSGDKLIGLPCDPDHRACSDCWKSYLTDSIQSGTSGGTSALNTTCVQAGCSERVGFTVFEMLLDEDEVTAKQFDTVLTNSFVDESDLFTWCPRVGCTKVLRSNLPEAGSSSISPTLQCDCLEKFCISCKNQAHAPSTCNEALQWNARDKGTESVDAKYLIDNSKPCPHCGARTEKNGGCLFMTCARCTKNWCWKCGGFDHHVWDCNREIYKHDDSDEIKTMKRYLEYYKSFFEHGRSVEAIQTQMNDVQEKMAKLVESGTNYKNAEFLLQASKVLLDARRVLRWSFVRRFYIEDETNNARLFEYRQKELERLVESLNQLTEGKPEELLSKRQTVLDFTKALNSYVVSFEADQAKARFIENTNKSGDKVKGDSSSSSSSSDSERPSKKKLKSTPFDDDDDALNDEDLGDDDGGGSDDDGGEDEDVDAVEAEDESEQMQPVDE